MVAGDCPFPRGTKLVEHKKFTAQVSPAHFTYVEPNAVLEFSFPDGKRWGRMMNIFRADDTLILKMLFFQPWKKIVVQYLHRPQTIYLPLGLPGIKLEARCLFYQISPQVVILSPHLRQPFHSANEK